MARIVWTDESLTWLRAIRDYIARDNPSAADRTIDGIFEKAQLLANNPEIGFRYSLPGRDDIRVLLYGHYRIAYTITDANTIHVLGIFHAALDIDRFFPDLSN
jgi:plasmid stabilization system protein ParE